MQRRRNLVDGQFTRRLREPEHTPRTRFCATSLAHPQPTASPVTRPVSPLTHLAAPCPCALRTRYSFRYQRIQPIRLHRIPPIRGQRIPPPTSAGFDAEDRVCGGDSLERLDGCVPGHREVRTRVDRSREICLDDRCSGFGRHLDQVHLGLTPMFDGRPAAARMFHTHGERSPSIDTM